MLTRIFQMSGARLPNPWRNRILAVIYHLLADLDCGRDDVLVGVGLSDLVDDVVNEDLIARSAE